MKKTRAYSSHDDKKYTKETIEEPCELTDRAGEQGWSNIPRGKHMFMLLMKLESAGFRATEDQRGAARDRSETP